MTRVNKGIRAEYKVRDRYRKGGWYVVRSAGSHGAYDLVCIHPIKMLIHLIQIKRGTARYVASADKDIQTPVPEGNYAVWNIKELIIDE